MYRNQLASSSELLKQKLLSDLISAYRKMRSSSARGRCSAG